MATADFTTTIVVDQTPEQAFNAITNPRGWWSTDFEGHSEKLNDIFTVRFGETFITIKVTELVPYKKIGWHVIDGYKHWLKNKKEWHHTKMSWELTTDHDTTQISFTHFGLVPGMECYEGCEKAWDFYLEESLFKLLTEEKGIPELK